MDTEANTVHFFVLQHGNHGKREDFKNFEEHLKKQEWPGHLHILRTTGNEKDTSIGVLKGGEILAQEIIQELHALRKRFLQNKIKLSLCGHSLGGLFARAALKHLFDEKNQTSLHNVEFISYVSMSSPHLGVQKPASNWADDGSIFRNLHRSVVNLACTQFNATTGTDLILLNDVLKDLSTETYLNKFKNATLVSLAHNDLVVPFPTSAISFVNPYPELEFRQSLTLVGVTEFTEDYHDLSMGSISLKSVHREQFEFEKGLYSQTRGADNKLHTEACVSTLRSLNLNVRFRRIDLDIGRAYTLNAHNFALGKAPHVAPLVSDLAGSNEFMKFMTSVLLKDHSL